MFDESFGDTLKLVEIILVDYFGWIPFVWLFVWIGYKLWLDRQIGKFLATVKWVFLEVRVDELNEKSPVAMEHIFSSLQALSQNLTLGEQWAGRIALHMSAEIVSIGGRVSYVFKVPEKFRNLLESALFAQYPKAEIREVQDYLANLPRNYDPQTSEFEFWGTQLIKRADKAYPIRTYKQADEFFGHSQQKTTVDSMAGIIEVMSNIQPYELLAVQLVIKPAGEDWKKGAADVVNKLKGIPPKAKPPGLFDTIFLQGPGMILDLLLEGLGMKGEEEKKKEEKPQPLTQSMTDSEKFVIDAIVSGFQKQSFETRMRVLYLAPKDKFSKGTRLPEILGAFRNFDNPLLNGLKPDSANVTTDATYKLFQSLEQPWLDHKLKVRKNKFLKHFKDRGHWEGGTTTIFNTEELATLFHFPQAPNARVSQLERVNTVKSAPPIDLPVG